MYCVGTETGREIEMWVHFDTRKKAEDHLAVSGFSLVNNKGRWVSKDLVVSADIHPVRDEIVCIRFAEVPRKEPNHA